MLGVIFVVFVGVVCAYYTRAGSDITPRPADGLGGDHEAAAPGAEGHEQDRRPGRR
jgi:hypothetical protein